MAQDVIGLCLETYAKVLGDVPAPSDPGKIKCDSNDFIALIEFDKVAYQKKYDTKAVKKTLTIPSWLNSLAEEQHINFSSVLQSALKEQLNIQ